MSSGFFQPFLDDYTQMLACPDPLLLEDFRLGQLEAGEQAAVQGHLDGCAACRQRLHHLQQTPAKAFGGTEPPPAAAVPEAASGSHPAGFAMGQIWSTRAELQLADFGLPDRGTPVKAGFLRLFVIVGIGPLQLGRFQELSLCPLSEFSDLASDRDLLLDAQATPFDEPLMLETWNTVPALALQLESCHGALAAEALAQLLGMLQGQPGSARRGGKLISEEGPHARFQAHEHAQVAYLAEPLRALAELRRLSSQYLLRVTPKGLQPPTGALPPISVFPSRLEKRRDQVLAAASDATAGEAAKPAFKERLELAPDCLLELWVEGGNLEFYAHSSEQLPLTGLQISYPDAQGQLQTLLSDRLGTAFIPLNQLATGEILLGFSLAQPPISKWLPVQVQS
ncbi:MAG TPA: zf-HC2 domain-containing protein [Candidatus Obscuribacterales bacterium]